MLTNKKKNIQAEEIFKEIRSGKSGRDKVLTDLYKNEKLRSGMMSVILRMGGSKENFKDVFANTLMQFAKTVIQKPDLVIWSELNTYIIGIAKYMWLAQRKKDNKYEYHENINSEEEWEDSPETLVLEKDKIHLLHDLLQQLGDSCKEVLMYWANGYRMKEIAELMDYKSDNMAKKKKYKCFKALLLYVEQNPQIKSALRD